MLFETDSYFHIGHAHLNAGKPCQDYALAATYGVAAYAIVADGCSTGGKTDVGARIVALATAKTLKQCGTRFLADPPRAAATGIALRQRFTITGIQEIVGLAQADMHST